VGKRQTCSDIPAARLDERRGVLLFEPMSIQIYMNKAVAEAATI
jgi:hypothetical protein